LDCKSPEKKKFGKRLSTGAWIAKVPKRRNLAKDLAPELGLQNFAQKKNGKLVEHVERSSLDLRVTARSESCQVLL
jgi:hypothetical protein